jgi:futalosine nucleosidase
MNKILFTAAEQEELDCAKYAYKIYAQKLPDLEVDFMLTGIGTTSTCYRLTKQILQANAEGKPYNLIINVGIAGSYDLEKFPIGSAAIIKKEYFGDLGFETMFGFQTLFEYDLLDADVFPYKSGALNLQPTPYQNIEKLLEKYNKAVGVTVQTVTGNPAKVENIYKQFNPNIESMEGAAVYYVCILEKIPFFELRTVSNKVGERDKSKWNIPLALDTLTSCCKDIFNSYL